MLNYAAVLHSSSSEAELSLKAFFLSQIQLLSSIWLQLSPPPRLYQRNGGGSKLENGGKIIKLPLLLRQPLSKPSLTRPGYWIVIFQAAEHIQAINLLFFLPSLPLRKSNSHFHTSSYKNMYHSPPPPNFQAYQTTEV